MSEHTPTPWTSEHIKMNGPKIYAGDHEGDAVCQLFDKYGCAFANASGNAALIVKAVNSHAALVNALERCIVDLEASRTLAQHTLGEPHGINQTLEIARAALAFPIG